MMDRLRYGDARDWFFRKRFGMFVHWGLYAIPAWHEQILWRGKMPRREYEPLIKEFNPVRFDPMEWMDLMDAAGMEFLCLTSKHHDGFCMFDSKYTDYKITNTPYGKDISKMLADACAKRGKGFGFYYSIPDWHHPNYPNQGRHHEMLGPRPGDEPDAGLYARYMENQVRELMTGYGSIDQLFWDINVMGYNNTAFNDEMRALQPSLVINNRGPDNYDYVTPEREVPSGMEFQKRTMAVQSLGRESWGHRIEEDYYTPKYLMQSIDRVLAMGGSYQLNIGPKADGSLDERDVRSLQTIGDWYKRVGEAFGDATPATHMITQAVEHMRDPVLLTRRGNAIYVHIYEDLHTTGLSLKPFDRLPVKATLLNTGEPLACVVDKVPFYHRDDHPYLRVCDLPVEQLAGEVMVIKLEMDPALCE